MKKPSSPFSLQKNRFTYDKAPMAYDSSQKRADSRELGGNSIWLSKKMVDEGCTLGQTLQVMEERCKTCNVISPMLCAEQCDTWKVKKELREVNKILSENDHGLRLLNTVKNKRRLAILAALVEYPLSLEDLQKTLGRRGYHHSQRTIIGYLKPLIEAGLVEDRKRLKVTLYGRRINDAVAKHGFSGQLPIHSGGHEEKILRTLLASPKTREELLRVAPAKGMSRTVNRLQTRNLILNNSSSDRIFYFRTKRSTNLERLTPTQRRLHEAIPQAGISARSLSKTANVKLRRVYKYLRNLRGKKLVFRREIPLHYELTTTGKDVAQFLEEISNIK
jgi:predicted transcriptional regulator